MVYLAQRLLATIPTVLGVVTLAFLLIHIAPGDPAELLLGDYTGVTPEVLADLRARLGLDRPLPVQYLTYVASVLRGDLGKSFRTNQPVMSEIVTQAPFTVVLAAAGVLLAILVGVPSGIITAVRRNSAADYATTPARRRALRTAAIPVITIIGIDVPSLLGGESAIEPVFAGPGLGKLVVDAIYARD